MSNRSESSTHRAGLVIVGFVTLIVVIFASLLIVPRLLDLATQKVAATPVTGTTETPVLAKQVPPEIPFIASDYPCSPTLTAIYRQNAKLDSMNQSVVPDTSYCLSAEKVVESLPVSKRVASLLDTYCTNGNDPSKQLALDHIYGSLFGALKMTYEAWAGYTLVDWHRTTTSKQTVYMDKDWGIPSLRPLAKTKCPSATTHPTE